MSKDHSIPQAASDDLSILLTERELAARWNKSVRTLKRWRSAGIGPSYILIGNSARYRIEQIQEYEAANEKILKTAARPETDG